jgi:hypothetical protein
MVIALPPLLQSVRALDLLLVDRAAGEIVERLLGDADDVMLDELAVLTGEIRAEYNMLARRLYRETRSVKHARAQPFRCLAAHAGQPSRRMALF